MRISELAAVVSERLLSELASEMAGKKTSAGCVLCCTCVELEAHLRRDVTGLREWTGRTTEALAKVLAAIRTLREWHLSDPNLLQMVGTKALEADALVERAANDLYTIAAELKFAKYAFIERCDTMIHLMELYIIVSLCVYLYTEEISRFATA